MEGAIAGPRRPGSVLGLASGYMAMLVLVHVASFVTRRTSLSPDRLQYWAAWRLSSGRSDVPCMYLPLAAVRGYIVLQHWLLAATLQAHPVTEETPGGSNDLIQNLKASPFRSPMKSFVLKQKTRPGHLVAAWPPAHPWTRLPCYGGQDQDLQGRKDARVADRAYPLSPIAAAGG